MFSTRPYSSIHSSASTGNPSIYLFSSGMACVPLRNANSAFLFHKYYAISPSPFLQLGVKSCTLFNTGTFIPRCLNGKRSFTLPEKRFISWKFSKNERFSIHTSSSSSNSSGSPDESSDDQKEKTPFGYTRKDVLLIGLGVTLLGFILKSGLEFVGVDPLQAGNVVQLLLVLGLTVGWISTYIFRVSNKDMTYAQQLRDYENKVMEKRLESLTEAERAALLQEVEEEKSR